MYEIGVDRFMEIKYYYSLPWFARDMHRNKTFFQKITI
jgi:hypothetical protein